MKKKENKTGPRQAADAKPADEGGQLDSEQDAAPPAAGNATPQSETDASKDRLLRLQADFDNFRRRTARERLEARESANEELMRELIPVLDHFELGLKTSVDQGAEKRVHEGFRIVYDQFLNTLKKFGLTPLDVHEPSFDPHLHEAVSHVPSVEHEADEIIQQTRRGYKLGEKLLRPIQVVVSSGPGPTRDDEVRPGAPTEKPTNGY